MLLLTIHVVIIDTYYSFFLYEVFFNIFVIFLPVIFALLYYCITIAKLPRYNFDSFDKLRV